MLFIFRSIVSILLFCFIALTLYYIVVAIKTGEGISISGFKKFCSCFPTVIHIKRSFTRSRSASDDWGDNIDCNNDYGLIKYENLMSELNHVKDRNEKLTVLLNTKNDETAVREKEWSTIYNNLKLEITKLKGSIEKLNSRIFELTNITGKLHPIPEFEVAVPFCNFFELMNGILNRAVVSTVNLPINSYSELQIADFLALITIEEDSLSADPVRWYTLLKSSPALTMEAAKDIVSKSPKEQLLYLQKHLFLEYLRPKISQTLLFLDKSRIHLIQIKSSTLHIDSIIEDFVDALKTYGISIVHYNTFDILSTDRYDLLEIKHSELIHDKIGAENQILSIFKYGVNAHFLGENDDKTILEMKI